MTDTAHSMTDGFNNTEAALDPLQYNPEIDQRIQQAIVRLMGFNTPQNRWRFIQTDVQGRLLTSPANVGTSNYNFFQVSVPNGGITFIIAANPNRRLLILQNISGDTLYFSSNPAMTQAIGFPLNVGDIWIDNAFVGPIYCTGTGIGALLQVGEV